TLKLVKEAMLTAGAKRLDYVWSTKRGSSQIVTDVHVIEVDLTNPHVSLNTMSGRSNSIGQVNNILNMTRENGAVGGINGDVYVMAQEGAPLGPQINNGSLLT